MGLAAAEMALADAAFRPAEHDPYAMSVITASSSGGNEFGQRRDPEAVVPGSTLRRRLPVDRVVLRGDDRPDLDPLRDEGPLRRRRRRGRRRARGARAEPRAPCAGACEAVVSGGLEAPIGPYALCCQLANGRLDADSSADAYRPFDERATGYLPGEGGAILLVESCRVGARTRRGASTARSPATAPRTTDACPGRAPGRTPARAGDPPRARRRRASRRTRSTSSSPTAPARLEADAAEAAALHPALGERSRSVPGDRAQDDGRAQLRRRRVARRRRRRCSSMRDGCIPPTINVERPASHGLRLVRDARRDGADCAPRSSSPAATAASTARSSFAAIPDPIHPPRRQHVLPQFTHADLRQILIDRIGLTEADIPDDPDTAFADIGLDSLAVVEIQLAVAAAVRLRDPGRGRRRHDDVRRGCRLRQRPPLDRGGRLRCPARPTTRS